MSTTTRATVDDLYRVKSKAELINGRLHIMAPTGDMPSRANRVG